MMRKMLKWVHELSAIFLAAVLAGAVADITTGIWPDTAERNLNIGLAFGMFAWMIVEKIERMPRHEGMRQEDSNG